MHMTFRKRQIFKSMIVRKRKNFKNITVRKIQMFKYMNLGERINKSLKINILMEY